MGAGPTEPSRAGHVRDHELAQRGHGLGSGRRNSRGRGRETGLGRCPPSRFMSSQYDRRCSGIQDGNDTERAYDQYHNANPALHWLTHIVTPRRTMLRRLFKFPLTGRFAIHISSRVPQARARGNHTWGISAGRNPKVLVAKLQEKRAAVPEVGVRTCRSPDTPGGPPPLRWVGPLGREEVRWGYRTPGMAPPGRLGIRTPDTQEVLLREACRHQPKTQVPRSDTSSEPPVGRLPVPPPSREGRTSYRAAGERRRGSARALPQIPSRTPGKEGFHPRISERSVSDALVSL